MFIFLLHYLFYAFLDSDKGISLKWVDNYNVNFMTVLRSDGLRCPQVRIR